MQDRFQYVTVDTILAKYQRDFKGLDIVEGDAIEWIGEALGFMKYVSSSEEAIAFIEVKNYQATIPNGLHYIIQIGRNSQYETKEEDCTAATLLSDIVTPEAPVCEDCPPSNSLVLVGCDGEIIGDQEVAYFRPYFDLQYEYLGWANSRSYQEKFTPIRLANHSFFNTLVCKTEDNEGAYNTSGQRDEYTIVGDQLRFNFSEGYIALAYVRQRVDTITGYPMVPDDESAKAAITYYLGWKMKEMECWNHREGACQLAEKAEGKWLKYIKQFRNKSKMPWGTDEYQNLADQSNYLIPRRNRYYGFFGKLGHAEQRPFNDPDNRNKY